MLDLAHDVVAEVADEPAVQRRQVGQRGRAVVREQLLDRRQHAPIGGTSSAAACRDLDPAVAGDERGRRARPTNENRLQRSPCSTDSSRKPGLVADERAKAATGVVEVGEQLAPHRDDGVVGGRARGTRRRGSGAHRRHAAERAEEAGVLAGVAGALALLLDDEEQRVAVAVVVRRAHDWRSPEVSPLRHTSWRLRLQNTVRPVSSVARRVSSFIHAIISTSPVPSSCTMAGTRPSALYVTVASCSSGRRRWGCQWAWARRS